MADTLVLDSEERKVYNFIMEEDDIEDLYRSRKEYWYSAFLLTNETIRKLRDKEEDLIPLTVRETIAITTSFISEDELINEVEKLQDDYKPARSRRAFQKLDDLLIVVSGTQLDLQRKVFFLFLGKTVEESTSQNHNDGE
jgi:hypothetical protein